MTKENARAFECNMDMLYRFIKEMRLEAYDLVPEALVKLEQDQANKNFCNDINISAALQVS